MIRWGWVWFALNLFVCGAACLIVVHALHVSGFQAQVVTLAAALVYAAVTSDFWQAFLRIGIPR